MPSSTIVIAMNVKTCSEWRSIKSFILFEDYIFGRKKYIICFVLIDVPKQKCKTSDHVRLHQNRNIFINQNIHNIKKV